MDKPPPAPTPSIRISDSNDLNLDYTGSPTSQLPSRDRPNCPTNHDPSQSFSHFNSEPDISSSHAPMAIPKSKQPLAPPPLPPPRFIEGLAHGHDSAWEWGNSFEDGANSVDSGNGSILAPIKPNSSLFGGHSRPPLVRRDETSLFNNENKTVGAEPRHRHSIGEGRTHSAMDTSSSVRNVKTGSRSLDAHSSSSRMGYSFQGEIPLSQKSVERSSNAYDQHLLAKIGGPASPPRQSLRVGESRSREFMTLPFHSKIRTSLSTLSIGDSSLSPQEAASRWNPGPPSAGVSPGTRGSGWSDYVGFRGAGHDNAGHSPMEIDQLSHARERHTGLAGSQGVDELSNLPSSSSRGAYDHTIFPDSDVDATKDRLKNYRRLSARERTSSYAEGMSPLSMQGMKRRASSPPQTTVPSDSHSHVFHPPSTSSDTEHRRMSGFPFNRCTSPGGRYQSSHGSISSMSSTSLRTGSYASSTGLSVGASSISSYERLSPGGISPTSELEHPYDKGLVSPVLQRSPPAISTPQPSRYHEPTETKKPHIVRKGSHSGGSISKHNPARLGRLYICECCPKKPKKLESLEELRSHAMEKQYMCHFCNKRFKNKNEAERHQNSLHLRRHSWSCASLSNYESAFHPSASPSYQSSNGVSHDTCGYCGAEFTNCPQPEWDRRIDHLTNVHKFGECNLAKKFYRADHFRQHLKHSHAGSSGKWTNILENACMKDEPSTSDCGLPSIGEQPSKMEASTLDIGMGPNPGRRTSHTIDEVIEES